MNLAHRTIVAVLVGGSLAACRSAPPPPLPPIPASSGSLLLSPGVSAPSVPAPSADQTVVDRVVAIVNGEVVTMSELQEAIIFFAREQRQAVPASEDLAELQRQVLDRMILHRLQVQEARRERTQVTEEELQRVLDDFVSRNGGDQKRVEEQLREQGLTWEGVRRELNEQLLVQKIRGRRIGRRATVTEQEIDAYVTANRGKFEEGLKYHPRHIAVLVAAPDQPVLWDRAWGEIGTLAERVRGGADFAELARAHSQDSSAGAGGDLGWLARGELQPLFEGEILKLRKGEVTPPIKSEAGYHLFFLEDREVLTPTMLVQLRQQARDLLLQQKAKERFDEWVEGLRRRALISIRL